MANITKSFDNDVFEAIIKAYNINGKINDIEKISGGNIHGTWKIEIEYPNGTKITKMIQQINTYVFPDYQSLMRNICLVTEHMAKDTNNGSQILKVLKTQNNKNYFEFEGKDKQKNVFRVYEFIDNCISFNSMSEINENIRLDIARIHGSSYGNFLSLLSDFPIEKLKETIPNFHNTEFRWRSFLKDLNMKKEKIELSNIDKIIKLFIEAVTKNDVNRAKNLTETINLLEETENPELNRIRISLKEITFLLEQSHNFSKLNKLHEEGFIPLRVQHNDPKLNNILFDKKIIQEPSKINIDTVMPVVDLDTVMLGLLSDPADALRSLTNVAGEETTNLEEVKVDIPILEAFIDGYASKTHDDLNDYEIENIGNAFLIITLELGMRFLNDYINGDIYFKLKEEDPKDFNLRRARVQLKLANNIIKNKNKIDTIITDSYKKHKGLSTTKKIMEKSITK